MRRGDDAEGAADLGPGGKAGHFLLSRMSHRCDPKLVGASSLGNHRSIVTAANHPIYVAVRPLSRARCPIARMVTSMPLDIPPDTTTTGEEFFRTEGAYAGLGAAIPGGQIARWILGEGPQIDSHVELIDELCWRLVGDGVPLWRATLYAGTLHPLIRGIGARWLRELKLVEDFRILHGSGETDEYMRSPIRATIERGTPFRRRLDAEIPEYPLLEKLRKAGATDYFALALNHTFRGFPVATWATDRPGGFTDADIEALEDINPALAAIIETRVVR